MSKKDNENFTEEKTDNKPEEQKYTGKLYAYIAIALTLAAVLFFGLSFTKMGIYSLLASALLLLAALTFENVQKRKNDFKWLKVLNVITYVIFAIELLLYVGGIIFAME